MKKKYILNGEVVTLPYTYTNESGNIVTTSSEEYLYGLGATDYVEPAPTPEEELASAKAEKVTEIDAYDTSSEVNEFSLNGVSMWLSLEERKNMRQSLTALEAKGIDTFSYWYNGMPITLPVSTFENIMNEVEVYALTCYNVTASHKAEVNALSSMTEVEEYDVTVGYPSKLAF